MSGVRDDIKFALKQARKNPGLVLVITIILGLGIGVNTTIFSLARASYNIPVHEPVRLVTLWSTNSARAIDRSPLSAGDFADLKANLRAVENLAAFADDAVNITGVGEPVRATVRRVTLAFFPVLGVQPVVGRAFSAEDLNQPVVILKYSTWRNSFAADPQILKRSVEIDGLSHRIIGVMPEIGMFSFGATLWTPMRDPTSSDDRTDRKLYAVGRVPSTVQMFMVPPDPRPRVAQLRKELTSLVKQLEVAHPEDRGWEFDIQGMTPMRTSEVVASGLFLFMPQFVLAIACANIANLLLARAAGRRREIALRIALGASRYRIVRLLIIESVLYALAGAVLGIVVGVWGTDLLRGFGNTPFWETAKVDGWVLAGSLMLAVLSGVLFGMAPALQTLRLGAVEALKQGGSNVTVDRKGRRLRNILMSAEVATATLLLLIVGLGVRSALNLRAVELGFRVERVMTFRVEVPAYSHPDLQAAAQTHLRLLERVRALPGVQFAGIGTRVPTAGGRNNHTEQLAIQGAGRIPPPEGDFAVDLSVSPGYFEALGIPLLQGRSFNSDDTAFREPVALVSRAMAERYWPGRDVLGKSVSLSSLGSNAPPITIVGVVADVRNDNASAPPLPMLYLPFAQRPLRTPTYVIQMAAGRAAPTDEIRSAIRRLEPRLPVFQFQSMSQIVYDDLAGTYFTVGLLAAFAILALFIATVGIFGVLSHITSERRSEIAIRIALGARPVQVMGVFVWKGLRIALYGVAAGVIVAASLTSILGSLFFGVSATDPIAFGLVTAGLLFVACFACYLPVRRATKLAPMSVLRGE